jgi:hypothetical protein
MLEQIKKALPEKIPTIQVDEDSLGPWSNSTVKSLEKCPLKFFLDKGLRIKAPEVLTEDSWVTYVGRAAHLWLERVTLGDTLSDGFEAAKEGHYHEVTDQYWHKVEELRGSVSKFQQRISEFISRNKVVKVYPELKIGITKDLKKTGFFSKDVYYRGVLDLPIQLENGDLVLLDHKYGGEGTWGLRNYMRQLNSQKVLYHYGIQNVRGVQSGIHFIQNAEVTMAPYVPRADIEEVLARELFMDIKDAVRNVQDTKQFGHKRGSQCKYCNYRSLCEGGKRGTAGELQFVIEESKQIFK